MATDRRGFLKGLAGGVTAVLSSRVRVNPANPQTLLCSDSFSADGLGITYRLSHPIDGPFKHQDALDPYGYGYIETVDSYESLGAIGSAFLWHYDPRAQTITRTIGPVPDGTITVRYETRCAPPAQPGRRP